MQTANDIQHGGDHYKRHDYQHWDFVTDLNMPYLLANATKYLTRWDKKNGLEDLKKAGHYVQKAIERDVEFCAFGSAGSIHTERLNRFCAQLPEAEARAVRAICYGTLYRALDEINALVYAAASVGDATE